MLEGACHCGAVKWSFTAPLESVTACNCTLCSRYGALWAYGHVGEDVSVSGPTKGYERGSKINKYNFCVVCGCVAYYLANKPNEKGFHRVAVNTRLATDPKKIQHLLIDHFEGFDTFEDLPRDGRCVKDLWF